MTEEVQNLEQIVESQEPSVEDLAREQGWVPKDDFNGESHKWVDAGEFLRRGELFEKIESTGKQNKALQREIGEMKQVLAEFKRHHDNVAKAAYERALSDLEAKKEEALIEGDAKLVVAVDRQLAEAREAFKEAKKEGPTHGQAAPQEEHPEFVAWKGKNSWYEQSLPMRGWADMRGIELAQAGKSPAEVLRIIEREIRDEFPKKFENPNRSRPGAVEQGTRKGTSSSSDRYDPSPDEQQVARKFVKQGLFKNEQEYYAELRGMKS